MWPGFFPDFTSSGVCISNPVLFFDRTTTNYGVVDSWNWDFGDATTGEDVSTFKNTEWSYADTGTKNVRFIVTNSKGCIDTIYKPVSVLAKPPITLPFRDTLICVPDDLQLHASGIGTFQLVTARRYCQPELARPYGESNYYNDLYCSAKPAGMYQHRLNYCEGSGSCYP